TENRTNGLAFPPCRGAMVVFGLGYGLERLAEVAWLRSAEVHYWGDTDTHGFGILNQLRARLPEARSFLMDRATLETHRVLWGQEPAERRYAGDVSRLTAEERAMFEDLVPDRLAGCVRLVQGRVGFGWLEARLETLERRWVNRLGRLKQGNGLSRLLKAAYRAGSKTACRRSPALSAVRLPGAAVPTEPLS